MFPYLVIKNNTQNISLVYPNKAYYYIL